MLIPHHLVISLTYFHSGRNGTITQSQRTKLTEIRSEIDRIKKTKQEYVAAHPEHKKLVFGEPKTGESSGASGSKDAMGKSPFRKNGLPRHPERSLYYHPVMNPYGMPPPGMPYVERRQLGILFLCLQPLINDLQPWRPMRW